MGREIMKGKESHFLLMLVCVSYTPCVCVLYKFDAKDTAHFVSAWGFALLEGRDIHSRFTLE